MAFGFGFGYRAPINIVGSSSFSPLSLFASSEPGAWYDPTDMTTMWQDAVTPVTALEQPVGLLMDKSRGLTLGAELVTNGGPFVNTNGWTAAAGVGSVPTLSVSGGKLRVSGAGGGSQYPYATFNFPTVAGKRYKFTARGYYVSGSDSSYMQKADNASGTTGFVATPQTPLGAGGTTFTAYFVANTTTTQIQLVTFDGAGVTDWDSISVKELQGNHAQSVTSLRPVLSARYNWLLGTDVLSTQSISSIAAQYRLYFTGTGSITLSGTATGTFTAGTNTITCTSGTLTLTVSGSVTQADLRLLSDANLSLPVYQRVTTATNYDSSQFPYFLLFDGLDDYMVTDQYFDFSSTNKMLVCMGANKLGDSAQGIMCELSTGGANTFTLSGPSGAGANNFQFTAGGSSQTSVAGGTAGPVNIVATGQSDISAPSNTLRINSVQVGSSAASQGTGNFSINPVYLGRRGAASLPFVGRVGNIVIRGAATSGADVVSTEKYIGSKMGLAL